MYQARRLSIALVAILPLFVISAEKAEGNPVQVGRSVVKQVRPIKPYRHPPLSSSTLTKLTRRTLASSDSSHLNIDALLQQAVHEKRIDDIEKLELLERYSAIPERGDFALLECLKVQSCDLYQFPDLATAVGRNQLHLQHAARCGGCNKVNVFKLSGNTIERMMDSFYQRGGWKKLEGEIGNSGIDGLYYKLGRSGQVVDVLVTEAKYNESILQETRSGTQMSKQWILNNLGRLRDRATQDEQPELVRLYGQVTRFVERDVYRAQLWHMNVDDDRLFIWREGISSKGRTITREPIHGDLPWSPGTVHAIDMLSPGSNFDRQILSDYEAILRSAAKNPLE